MPKGQLMLKLYDTTLRDGTKAKDDANIKALLKADTRVITLFGKSWDLHVKEALKITPEENLDLICDSLAYLKERVEELFYDAEHFFDGYKANPEYALKTLKAAQEAGAECLILCDTNGGTLPDELVEIFRDVKHHINAPIGIHAHNDSETAVANSILAVKEGAVQVHGTINGFGERCGNANLCSIIPNLKLKMGIDCISSEQLRRLRETARFVYELANLPHNKHQAYVGDSAFAHKGGVHVSAVLKKAETYEHIKPELVGNHQRILISDLSGRANIDRKSTR